jgi:hypothetical protein
MCGRLPCVGASSVAVFTAAVDKSIPVYANDASCAASALQCKRDHVNGVSRDISQNLLDWQSIRLCRLEP